MSQELERWVAEQADSFGASFGEVNDYGMWTGKIDLTDAVADELWATAVLSQYGSFLIVQQDGQGFVSVAGFPDVEGRDAEYDRLEAVYTAWLDEPEADA